MQKTVASPTVQNKYVGRKKHTNKAHKHATAWYAQEKAKGWKLGMSACQVCERVNEQYGINIQPHTV